MKHLTITLLTLLVLGGCSEVNLEDLTETEHISSSDSLVFVCKNFDEPLTFVIDQDTVTFGSVDVKNTFKILKRTASLIEWKDDSYVKLPFDVKHSLDLVNSEITIDVDGRKLDCIKTDLNKLLDYEKEMASIIEKEGWSPALPPLSLYLQVAENKDHPKVIHQMHLRCQSALAITTMLVFDTHGSSDCENLHMLSPEEAIKNCMSDTGFSTFKRFKKVYEYHVKESSELNRVGNYISSDQLNMQLTIFLKSYEKSLNEYLNQEISKSCWGRKSGLLCMDEELNMCQILRKEESMQDWYEGIRSNK